MKIEANELCKKTDNDFVPDFQDINLEVATFLTPEISEVDEVLPVSDNEFHKKAI